MRAQCTAQVALLAVAVCCTGSVGAQQSDADTVVVRRGGVALTLGEIDARMEEIPPDRRAGFIDSPERIDSTLSQMLLVEQLASEAVDSGLDADPRLAAQMEMHRKRLLASLRLAQLRTAASEKIDVAALARERYAADRGKFSEPERRSVRHLLVSTGNRSDAEALAAIRDVQRRLGAGEPLESLARELSDDEGSKGTGGFIADIPPGQTDPAFEQATFALSKPGSVTAEPVKSQFGYHLIELVSIQPARARPFEEVKAIVEAEVLAATVERSVKLHTDQLNSLPIEADPDTVASLRDRYGPRGSLPPEAPANQPSQAKPPQR